MTTGHYVCAVKRKIYKEDIIQSGYDLFYEKGYSVTGIKEITEKIDIPKGSFYNHFKSKEEFGIAVLDNYIQKNIAFLKQVLLNPEQSPINNLKQFFNDYIKLQEEELECSKGCLMANLTMELADVNQAFQLKAMNGFETVTAVFENCLNRAKDLGEINIDTDTETMASFIVNSWQGAALRMKADKSTDALKTFYQTLFSFIIK